LERTREKKIRCLVADEDEATSCPKEDKEERRANSTEKNTHLGEEEEGKKSPTWLPQSLWKKSGLRLLTTTDKNTHLKIEGGDTKTDFRLATELRDGKSGRKRRVTQEQTKKRFSISRGKKSSPAA